MCDFIKPLWRKLRPMPTIDILRGLERDPDNEALRQQLRPRIANAADFPHALADFFDAAVRPESAEGDRPVWKNWIGDQKAYPVAIKHPTSLQDLVDAVKEANAGKLSVRCVGSGHSFSDVATTDGILLDPHGMKKVLNLDASLLLDPARAGTLFSVESGITLHELDDTLDKLGLGLIQMGAYDGQTLAGAICTGTHGTGVSLGPMASYVRALTIVTSAGTVCQVEPSSASGAITDPAKFAAQQQQRPATARTVLKQDDDWFQTAVLGVGCTGLIYSYIIEVRPAYLLEEDRTATTWEKVKAEIAAAHAAAPSQSPFPPTAFDFRHFDISVNPYAVDGTHMCIVTTKNISDGPPAPHGWRGLPNWINGVLAGWDAAQSVLATFLNSLPWTSPDVINKALNTLVNRNYIDKSFRVMNVGIGQVEAMALELSIPADGWVATVDRLLAVFQEEAATKGWFLAGPIALRFVAAADAFLAPQQGRPTVMAELIMLGGVASGSELVKAVKARMVTKGSGIRVHWGLDLDTVTADEARDMYPLFDRWEAVYRQINETGAFDNRFTDRLGISVRGQGHS